MRRVSECGVVGVEVDQWVRGDSVEGQIASRTVHIHCCSTRGGGRGGGERGVFVFCCAWHSNHHQSSSDSRTDHSIQTNSLHCVLSCWLLCKSLLHELFLSTRPPSNSDQSDHFYTAAEAGSQICLDDQDMAAARSPRSPSCCCRTVWGFCSLCLCPVWVHRNLMERKRHNTAAVYHQTRLKGFYFTRMLFISIKLNEDTVCQPSLVSKVSVNRYHSCHLCL